MNKNMEVHEFSLKRIVENLDKIPKNGRFGEDVKLLSKEEKRELMELMANYNEYGKVLRCEEGIRELAEKIVKTAKLAETYALTESADWFQTEIVKRDFKQARRISQDFQKLAKECYGKLQQLNALFEDFAQINGRYFEIKNLEESGTIPSSPAVVQEPTKTFQSKPSQ